MPNNTRPDELMHYGVLGMKWGVRRYQNKDGSVTNAGKKRYSDKSPYEIKTADGDTFHVSRGSSNNYNTKKSKVTKTWGEHLHDVDNQKIQKKAEKQQFKKDVKQYRNDKKYIDFEISNYGNIRNVRNRGNEMLDSLRIDKGNEYADRILKADKRRSRATTVGMLAGSAAAVAGWGYLAAKYDL